MSKKDDEKFEDAIKTAETEGFDLGDILAGVKASTVDVKVFLDADAAYRAIELNAEIEDALNDDSVRAITDVPAETLVAELKEVRERMEASAMTFTLRSLSNAELTVIKRTVAHHNKIAKNLSEDERSAAEAERAEVVNEHILAVGCVAVTNASGKTNPGVTLDQAHSLREALPVSEWNKITEAALTAMSRASVVDQMMGDSTFRWADTEPGE